MRKLRRHRNKKQVRFAVALIVFLLTIMTVGYAAFSTNITLNARGNVIAASNASFGGISVQTVRSGDGLYDNGNNTYTYKGSNPNNYINFNNETWRIMSIDSIGIKIIKDEKLSTTMAYDTASTRTTANNSYCTNPLNGCDAWAATSHLVGTPSVFTNDEYTGTVTQDASLNTYLNGTYYTNILGSNSNIINGIFNVGPEDNEDDYQWQGHVALATISDYVNSSSSNNYTSNNYLIKNYDWWLLTPMLNFDDAPACVPSNGSYGEDAASSSFGIRPVVYLNKNIQLSGSGTSANKYTFSGSYVASQTIYAWHTNTITIGTSTVSDLASGAITPQPYYTSESDIISASGYPFFNKYTVLGGTITEGYSCHTFGVLSSAVCAQGGKDSNNVSFYNYNSSPGNWSVLNALSSNSTFTGGGGSCGYASNYSICDVGNLRLSATSGGLVGAYDYGASAQCSVNGNGTASCVD